MKSVHGVTQGDEDTRMAAFEVMAKLTEAYYPYLDQYMPGMMDMSCQVLSQAEPDDNVAMLAVQFLCTIAEVEITIHEKEENGETTFPSREHIQNRLAVLVQLLMSALAKQEENVDPQESDVPHSAGKCLELVSQCVRDNVSVS